MKILILASAIVLAISAPTEAKIYKFTFTNTISSASTPGINVGDTIKVDLFADNGGSSSLNQTWHLADLQNFTLEAGTYSATYSKVFEYSGSQFVTDGAGVVTSVAFYGTSGGSVNTDNFASSFNGDYVFGDASFNDSAFRQNRVASSTFTRASDWTVSAAGVPEPASWALIIVGFGLVGVAARRRSVTVAA